MDEYTLGATRRSLHGIAETLLAGPEHRATGRIRLRVAPGGFSTLDLPGQPSRIAVEGLDLAVHRGTDIRRVPLHGTYADLGRAAGLDAGPPVGVYHDGSGVGLDDEITLDPAATRTIVEAFAIGDGALRQLAQAHDASGDGGEPILWPEHFDVGVTLGEVNFGVSPGDAGIGEPYAYVGPWKRRVGDFWDQPYGSARTIRELGDADAVLSYLESGWTRAALDPLA